MLHHALIPFQVAENGDKFRAILEATENVENDRVSISMVTSTRKNFHCI